LHATRTHAVRSRSAPTSPATPRLGPNQFRVNRPSAARTSREVASVISRARAVPRLQNTSGRSGRSSRSEVVLGTLPFSIWRSTARFVAVTPSPSGSKMSPPSDGLLGMIPPQCLFTPSEAWPRPVQLRTLGRRQPCRSRITGEGVSQVASFLGISDILNLG
jgi:hypothetical protein